MISCRSCTNMILRCKTCTQRWKTFGQVTLTNWQSLPPLPLLKCLPLVGPGSATKDWINQLRQTASERFSEDKRVSFQAGDMLEKWHLKRSSVQQNWAYLAHFLQRLICQINSFMGDNDVQIFDRLLNVEGTFSLLTERFMDTSIQQWSKNWIHCWRRVKTDKHQCWIISAHFSHLWDFLNLYSNEFLKAYPLFRVMPGGKVLPLSFCHIYNYGTVFFTLRNTGIVWLMSHSTASAGVLRIMKSYYASWFWTDEHMSSRCRLIS